MTAAHAKQHSCRRGFKLLAQLSLLLPLVMTISARGTAADDSIKSLPGVQMRLPNPMLGTVAWKIPEIETLIDTDSADGETWKKSQEALHVWGIYAAIQISVRGDVQPPLARDRLHQLLAELLADRSTASGQIWHAAEALESVGSNFGPRRKEFGGVELSLDKQKGKILHCFLVRDATYRGQLDGGRFWSAVSTSFIDINAASDLFNLDASIYSDMASLEQDAPKKGALIQRSKAARSNADECKSSADHMN